MSSSCPISCTAGKIGFLVNSSPSMQLNKKQFLVSKDYAKIPPSVFLNLISIESNVKIVSSSLKEKKRLNLANQECRDSSALPFTALHN